MTSHTNDIKEAKPWENAVWRALETLEEELAKEEDNGWSRTRIKVTALQAIVEANKKWLIGENENEDVGKIPGVKPTDRIAHWRNQLREEQRKAME